MKPFLFLILMSFLIGCSHSVILPGSYRQKPKSAEKQWGGEVGLGIQEMVSVEVFNDITTDPPQRTDGVDLDLLEIAIPILPFIDLSLGVFNNLDVYYTSGLGLRYQWLGDSKSTGWNAAVFAGAAGYGAQSDSENSGTTSADTEISGVEYGLSFGHYWTANNGLYLSVGTTDGKAKTKITQPTKIFKYDDQFDHTIISLGGTYGEKWYLWLEMSSISTKWKFDEGGSNTQDNSSFLVGTGVHW